MGEHPPTPSKGEMEMCFKRGKKEELKPQNILLTRSIPAAKISISSFVL